MLDELNNKLFNEERYLSVQNEIFCSRDISTAVSSNMLVFDTNVLDSVLFGVTVVATEMFTDPVTVTSSVIFIAVAVNSKFYRYTLYS